MFPSALPQQLTAIQLDRLGISNIVISTDCAYVLISKDENRIFQLIDVIV